MAHYSQGIFVLHPAITDSSTDAGVDGSVTIAAPGNANEAHMIDIS